jgi:putative methyltransferase (TIGR04325 family)
MMDIRRINPFVREYPNWDEALKRCSGYAAPNIIDKVHQSALKVRSGEAAYERDSVLFEKIQYSWPVLGALMWIAAQNDGQLNIVDFGGSLGTSYYQNKKFLGALKKTSWSIVEQPHFVELGKKEFETETLKFYPDLDSCMNASRARAILLSGVLQYLEHPYAVLQKIKSWRIKFVIVDKTPFQSGEKDRIVIQKAPDSIFKASFPSWIFSESKFRAFFKDDVILESFESFPKKLTGHSTFKGYIIQIRGN